MPKQPKKAVILHSTGATPLEGWLPWLKTELEDSDYSVFAPLLPENSVPNRHTYEAFLKASGWGFADNVLIGHSSGATTILNLLSSDWFPKVKAVVLAGTFLNEKLTKDAEWTTPGQFDNLFLDHYDAGVIRQKAQAFYFVHGSDDPYCDIEDARELCEQLGGTFIVVTNGHHLGATSGLTLLPQLTDALRQDHILQ